MIAALFLRTAAPAGDLIADEATADRWEEPSVLEGYTVGGLAGHLARAVLARLAVLREGGPAVVRSLARRERHPAAVRAL